MNNGDDRTPDGVFDLIELPPDELDAAWRQFVDNHILPGRLLRLAVARAIADNNERHHLEWCHSCSAAYRRYAASKDTPIANHVHSQNGNGRRLQQQLWPADGYANCVALLRSAESPKLDASCAVPTVLREHLHVVGPITFDGNQVAFESWQFGQLLSTQDKDAVLIDDLMCVLAQAVKTRLIQQVASNRLILVCFGRAMHRVGIRVAAEIGESGSTTPHVVLAHDFYSPTLVCDDKELKKSDVIVLVDVVHSGSTLDGLMTLCMNRGAHHVQGLALVDQSGGVSLCAEWSAIWTEPKEIRISLDDYRRSATKEEIRQLRRYDPNDEVGTNVPLFRTDNVTATTNNRLSLDNELLRHIHDTSALKRDYRIGAKCYPYAVNVLDLIKKSPGARAFVIERAAEKLTDLVGQNIAFAFHAGRRSRAGEIATLFSTEFGWPTIPIGTRGRTFSVTDEQLKQMARYDVVVVVDAAIRTGDTLSAIVRAIDDKWLLKHTKIMAICVLNALTTFSQLELACEIGVEIRTLFHLPLAPPTEEVRHWTSIQKTRIHEQLTASGEFGHVEHLLSSYCSRRNARHGRPVARNVEETQHLIKQALNGVHHAKPSTKTVDEACTANKPELIRHLAVGEVVHDRNVQELLMGVMFNSMTPSLKESAVFALASARNYEWMSREWLRLNRPFISTEGQAWKSVVMVECEMKLSGQHQELSRFRDAALELRNQEVLRMKAARPDVKQLSLPITIHEDAPDCGDERARQFPKSDVYIERLDAFALAAE